MLAAFILDSDIVFNELWRSYVKKEKKFQLNSLLDERSYTHKFWFHKPLPALLIVYLTSAWYLGTGFGLLTTCAIFFHLVHDTIDKNFDGVQWLWPFNQMSYKFRSGQGWIKKSKAQLYQEAAAMAKHSRSTKEILADNKF